MEAKDTSLGTHIYDGQSLEPIYPAFENLPKTFSEVRFGVVENLLVVILLPITIQQKEFASLFVTLKISKNLDNGENQSLDDLLNFMDTNLGALHGVSLINSPTAFTLTKWE